MIINMHYSYKEITKTFTPEKKLNTSIWDRIFCRPLSFPITYVLINIGVSANTVSVFAGAVGMLGCLFIMLGGHFALPGIIMLLLFSVLDAVDGNIARTKGKWSAGGEFFDGAGGTLADAFLYLAIGVAAYRTTSLFVENRYLFIILGATASIFDCMARCVYHRFMIAEYKQGTAKKEGSIESNRKKGKLRLVSRIKKEFGTAAFFLPLLVVAYIFNYFDMLTLLYFLYAGMLSLASICFLIIKGKALAKNE